MNGFKQFLSESINQDTKKTIEKLPQCCKNLLKNYKFKFQGGNTLKGDNDHIGENDLENKKITVASPWEYSRSFTVLHEIGHLFWNKYIQNNKQKQEEWHSLVKQNKNKLKQNDVELFCHAFANHFSKHKVLTHSHPKWDAFIEKEIKEAS
jgi:mRNA deadenylase 3'-5' endonuclease subunit Ccr4